MVLHSPITSRSHSVKEAPSPLVSFAFCAQLEMHDLISARCIFRRPGLSCDIMSQWHLTEKLVKVIFSSVDVKLILICHFLIVCATLLATSVSLFRINFPMHLCASTTNYIHSLLCARFCFTLSNFSVASPILSLVSFLSYQPLIQLSFALAAIVVLSDSGLTR